MEDDFLKTKPVALEVLVGLWEGRHCIVALICSAEVTDAMEPLDPLKLTGLPHHALTSMVFRTYGWNGQVFRCR